MKNDISIPKMGESISQATIGQIFKPSGSFVNQDDEILELETDKVNQVLFAPASGKVELTIKTGDEVTIDQVIGSVDSEAQNEQAPKTVVEEPATVVKKEEPRASVSQELPKESSPASMAISRESRQSYLENLDPQETPKVEKAEVKKEQELPSPSRPVLEPSRTKMSRMRQTIAKRLVQAKTETAMLTTFNEVDLTEVMALREKYKEAFQKKYGIKMGFMPFFVLATISALKEFPLLNASIEGDEIIEKGSIDMGVAVSTDKGLVVPVIKNADTLSFSEIESQMASLAKKARDSTLTIDDIRGGSFTITNGGAFGSLFSTPILNFPQSGILGMHGIQKRPVVIGDEIKIRSMMYLALSYDHRLVDGREAVLFIMHIKGLLEEPGRFLIGV